MKFEERYSLQVPLGETVRGSVWSGRDDKFKRSVAIVQLDEDAGDEAADAFLELWNGAKEARHPSLARVFDVGRTDEGVPFAALELADGESLASRMSEGPALRADHAVRLAIEIADALAALHAKGVHHGDVEPGNVYVRERGGRVIPKLLGLGLGRTRVRTGAEPLDEPDHLATLAYMSPEQASATEVASPASDAYSTAALLYALLTGRLAHHGEDADAIRAHARDEAVPPVAAVRPELEGPIAEVLDQALATDAGERFDDCVTFSKALRTALLKSRKPGAHETVVGPRSLSPEPIEPRAVPKPVAAAVAPKTPAKPTPAVLPAARPMPAAGPMPPAKPLPPAKPPPVVAKPETGPASEPSAADDRESGLDEDELEFERLSGLIDLRGDEPKRIGAKGAPPPPPRPPSAAKLPAPARRGEPEEDEPEAIDDDQAPAAGEADKATAVDDGDDAVSEGAAGDGEATDDAPAAEEEEGLAASDGEDASGPDDVIAGGEPAAEADSTEGDSTEADSTEGHGDESDGDEGEADAIDERDAIDEHGADEGDAGAPEASSDAGDAADDEAGPVADEDEVAAAPAGEPDAPAPEDDDEDVLGPPATLVEPVVAADDDEELKVAPAVPLWVWGVAAAAVLGLVVGGALMMGGDDDEATTPIANAAADGTEVQEAEPLPEEPVVADTLAEDPALGEDALPEGEIVEGEPEPVVLTLAGVPEGATVTYAGEAVDGSSIELDPSGEPATLRVTLDGHVPFEREVSPTESQTVEVALEAEPEPEPRVARRPREGRRAGRAARRGGRRAAARRGRTTRRGGGRPTAVTNPGF